MFGGDTWGPRPSATPSPQLLRLPQGPAVAFDVQMNQPGQEKPRGFMNSSSMMSFQSYPPEEHLLSPSSPAPPSQAFLSPPPSQAWGAMLLPRSKIPSANEAACQSPVPYSSRFGICTIPDCSPMEGSSEPEMKSCNSIYSQPKSCQLCNSRAVEKKGTNNCDGNHSLETSRGNYTPARGRRIIKR